MNASVTWKQGETYEGKTNSGYALVMDAAAEHKAGPSPMELVLTALCGCTSMDVASILQKKREPVEGLTVSAEAEQATEPPRVFTKIHLTYRIKGKVSRKAAEDAVSLSKNKYCSVSKMIEKTAAIDYSIEMES